MIPLFDPSSDHVFIFGRYAGQAMTRHVEDNLQREVKFMGRVAPASRLITQLLNDGWQITGDVVAHLAHHDWEVRYYLTDLDHAFAKFVSARGAESGERAAAEWLVKRP